LLKVVTIMFFQTLIATAKGLNVVQSAGGPAEETKVLKRHG